VQPWKRTDPSRPLPCSKPPCNQGFRCLELGRSPASPAGTTPQAPADRDSASSTSRVGAEDNFFVLLENGDEAVTYPPGGTKEVEADMEDIKDEATSDQGNELELELDDAVPAFNIQLGPTGDQGSGFHFQNDPTKPYQRDRIVDREGAVDIRCSSVDVIHGYFAPDGENFCTLLVLQFRFDPRRRARRLAQVDIELRFASSVPGGADPVVHAIAPDGRFSFAQTTQHEKAFYESKLHATGGMVGMAEVGGAVKFGREVSREMRHATTVVGSISVRGRNYGSPNSVIWTLMENPETKTGVPVAMKTAILLKRRDEGKFHYVVSLKAKADWRTKMEWLVGTTKPDDPVLFDPTLPSTSDKYSEMELKLGELDLEPISDIIMMNLVEGVFKTRKIGGEELQKNYTSDF